MAEPLLRQSAEMGNARAMGDLGYLCEEAGDADGAEEWYQKATKAGDGHATYRLAQKLEELGDAEGAERLYRQALNRGDTESLGALGRIILDRGGDAFESLTMLNRSILHLIRQTARTMIASLDRATGAEKHSTIGRWAERKEGERLRSRIEEVGDKGDFDRFREAVAEGNRNGDTYGIFCHYLFLGMKDHDRAGAMLERAGRDGNSYALMEIAKEREKTGSLDEADAIYRTLLDSGDNAPLAPLAGLMRTAGNLKEAESLYWRSVEAGSTYAMFRLCELKEDMGDHASAEEIALQAANAGDASAVRVLSGARGGRAEPDGLWPYGLNPDGTPTVEPWWLP
ncbi:SEL1-like repeat protein [Streptomyces scabichelini]|uniref:SEL1-like repeat protein n=1 Tax=Streptomyces scabichelini TaxID=2711217 RepID=UPI001F49F522|nr:tetratricopeptide repeat protein [Streptomyces scabichelini]